MTWAKQHLAAEKALLTKWIYNSYTVSTTDNETNNFTEILYIIWGSFLFWEHQLTVTAITEFYFRHFKMIKLKEMLNATTQHHSHYQMLRFPLRPSGGSSWPLSWSRETATSSPRRRRRSAVMAAKVNAWHFLFGTLLSVCFSMNNRLYC